jgi:hypothetical protein
MLFQILDTKHECVGYFADNKLHFEDIPDNLTATWAYSAHLGQLDVEYANIYCNGASLQDVCPQHLKKDWEFANKQMKAFISSFIEAMVSLDDNCFFDMVPAKFLIEYYGLKNKITDYVLQNYERPQEYDFFRDMTKLINKISTQELNLNLDVLREDIKNEEDMELYRKYCNVSNKINYNLYGAVTGRLGMLENSFPILNLNRKARKIVEPTNDWFVEIDLNAAEMRMFLALAGVSQPESDLYETLNNKIYNNSLTRAQAKDKTILWLYNNRNHKHDEYEEKLEQWFDKVGTMSKYYDGTYLTTPYGRKIEVDAQKAPNYLGQSCLIDMFHRQIVKVHKKLTKYESFIPFMVHDCFYIDLKDEEKAILPEIVRSFSQTPYGKFPAKVKIGRNLGEMKEVKLKL